MGASVAAALIGLIALLGWVVQIQALKTDVPDLTTIKADVGLEPFVAALAVFSLGEARSRPGWRVFAAVLLGAAVALIAFKTVIQYPFHFSLGERQMRDPNSISLPYPDGMWRASAAAFFALGLAILVLAVTRSRIGVNVAHALTTVPAVVGYLSLVGAFYHGGSLQNFGALARVAVLNAAGLCCLSTAILATRWQEGWGSAYWDRPISRRVLFRFFSLALIIPFPAGLLVILCLHLGLYQPLFEPAVLAALSALALVGIAIFAARTVLGTETALSAARAHAERQTAVAGAAFRDLSEQRRTEALTEEFVATVSHELRTPLTSIAGSLGLLKGGAGGRLPPRAARLVEIAEGNSSRLIHLINDILDMEKIRTGEERFQEQPLQIQALATLACEAMSGLAEDCDVSLNAAPIDPGVWVVGDQDRLMQVMANLLSNAIKASPVGGTVQIEVDTSGPWCRLKVIDHGSGIPEAFRARIFNRFARATGSDRRGFSGTGLGLSIVKEIIERHGGSVSFETTEGVGSIFCIHLALVQPTSNLIDVTLAPAPCVLICEDDDLVAEYLAAEVQLLGCRTESVSTAKEAREALQEGRHEALLLDMRLPDSDGISLMRALRSAPATAALPIIAMSGSPELQVQAYTLGAVDWLSKPFNPPALRAALNSALRSGRPERPLILHSDDKAAPSWWPRVGLTVSEG